MLSTDKMQEEKNRKLGPVWKMLTVQRSHEWNPLKFLKENLVSFESTSLKAKNRTIMVQWSHSFLSYRFSEVTHLSTKSAHI